MSDNYSRGAVEAILFASGEPVSAARIAEASGIDTELVEEILEELTIELDEKMSGVCLLRFDDRYQLTTRNTYSGQVRNILDNRRNTPLSQAAMETLAIIAYNQPVSRSFIEQVRGVDSSSSVTNLLNRGLITEAGRLELPGRPVSFKTTDVFLRTFGFSGLDELPSLPAENEPSGVDEFEETED